MKKTYKDLPLDAKLNILEYFTPDELVDAHRIPNSTILESQDFIVDFQQVRDFQYTQVDVPFSVPQFLDLVKKTSWNIFIKVVCSNIPVDFDIGEAVKDIFHDPHRSIKIIVENISTVDIFGEKKSFIDSIFVEHKVTTSSCTHFQTLFNDFKSIYLYRNDVKYIARAFLNIENAAVDSAYGNILDHASDRICHQIVPLFEYGRSLQHATLSIHGNYDSIFYCPDTIIVLLEYNTDINSVNKFIIRQTQMEKYRVSGHEYIHEFNINFQHPSDNLYIVAEKNSIESVTMSWDNFHMKVSGDDIWIDKGIDYDNLYSFPLGQFAQDTGLDEITLKNSHIADIRERLSGLSGLNFTPIYGLSSIQINFKNTSLDEREVLIFTRNYNVLKLGQ